MSPHYRTVKPITWHTRALGGIDFHAVFVCDRHEQEYRRAADLLRVSLAEGRNHQKRPCDWCADGSDPRSICPECNTPLLLDEVLHGCEACNATSGSDPSQASSS